MVGHPFEGGGCVKVDLTPSGVHGRVIDCCEVEEGVGFGLGE